MTYDWNSGLRCICFWSKIRFTRKENITVVLSSNEECVNRGFNAQKRANFGDDLS